MHDALSPRSERDPQYPNCTNPDPIYPGQTRQPLGAPLDEIATPAMWSRLNKPLARVIVELWRALGLRETVLPEQLVTIHYGRIALNAHAWERLRARHRAEPPDPVLVEPPGSTLEGWSDALERARAGWRGRRLTRRIESAAERREQALDRIAQLDLAERDTAELARGPLDDVSWCEVLLPWLAADLDGDRAEAADPSIRSGIALEQRWAFELGRRLAARGQIQGPADVAYLTVPERTRCVHEDSDYWAELAADRQSRIDGFTKLDVPALFWGRPRADADIADGVSY